MNTENEKDLAVLALAARMHQEWRDNRKEDATESYTPRIKTTEDTDWIKAHGGATEVDIANTAFEDLPKDWQKENLKSAKEAIERAEDALYLIHDGWLDRNDKTASEDQKVQYSRLPKEEKLKDLEILEEALQVMKNNL